MKNVKPALCSLLMESTTWIAQGCNCCIVFDVKLGKNVRRIARLLLMVMQLRKTLH
jgi:hypothetical protein